MALTFDEIETITQSWMSDDCGNQYRFRSDKTKARIKDMLWRGVCDRKLPETEEVMIAQEKIWEDAKDMEWETLTAPTLGKALRETTEDRVDLGLFDKEPTTWKAARPTSETRGRSDGHIEKSWDNTTTAKPKGKAKRQPRQLMTREEAMAQRVRSINHQGNVVASVIVFMFALFLFLTFI